MRFDRLHSLRCSNSPMAGSDSIWVAITPKRDWVVFSLDREQEVDFTRARVHLGALTQELAWVDSSEVITETLVGNIFLRCSSIPGTMRRFRIFHEQLLPFPFLYISILSVASRSIDFP